MDVIESSGSTVEEAVAQALAELGVSRDNVKVEVLGTSGSGASDEARVRVSRRETEIPASEQPTDNAEADSAASEQAKELLAQQSTCKLAQQILEDLLDLLELNGEVQVLSVNPPTLNIVAADSGVLIGRRGESLDALQLLVNAMVSHRVHARVRISVDVEHYRSRREQNLQSLALRVAERVREVRQPLALEAMPAYERRIVHMALQDNPDVETASIGEGEARKVVISPRA